MTDEPIRDMDEFVRKWSTRVRATIRRFGIRNEDQINDLEQDVYTRMIIYNILAINDPKKSKFSTLIFQVIRTVVLNYIRKCKRDPIACSEPLMMQIDGDDEFLHPEIAKKLVTADTEGNPVDEFMERLYKELAKVPSWTSESRHGKSVKSLTVVCRLIQYGYRPKEIAKALKVGESAVSCWVKKIRTIAQELHDRELADVG